MTALASTLNLLLAVQDATPAATTTASATCELTDNACKARLFIKKAAAAQPPQRAMYLFTAHRSYVALFAKTGEARYLCAARVNFDRSLAVKGQSDQQRASFERSRAELEALEQKHGPRCNASGKGKMRQPSRVAKAVDPAPTAAVPEETKEVAMAMLGAESESAALDGLLDVPATRTASLPLPAATVEVPKASLRRAPVPGRPLVIAGGTTLGLGLVLTGVAGYAGARVADASRRAFDNYEQVQGQGDADALATHASLRREFDRWLPVTVSTAVVGTTALIVGAVLVRMGVRKMRDPLRAALVPVPNGIVIHARF